jgi:DNA invertase Pin-like site-specific DNA recombinase
MLIGYMRVSSDGDRQNTNLQRDALTKAGVDERHLFEDKVSGAKSNRPGLQQALDYVREGDVLVVWKLDRLGRSLSNLLDIVNVLRDRGVGFRSLTEQMDTTTAHGEFLFNVFGSLAQYERALIKERVNAGLEAAARRGKRGGRPRAISEDTLEAIKKTLEEGKTRAEACRIFGVKRGTLDDSLKRVGYV